MVANLALLFNSNTPALFSVVYLTEKKELDEKGTNNYMFKENYARSK